MSLRIATKLVVTMLLWAACFPLISLGIESAPHMTFATMRAFLAGSVLLAIAFSLGRAAAISWREWAQIAIIGFGATSLGFLGMFHAAEFVAPGIATVIANTQPIMASALAGVFLGERIEPNRWVGLVCGFLGVTVIALSQLLQSDQDSYRIGIMYIGLAAIGVTISNVLIKRLAGKIDALFAMGAQLLIGSIPLGLLAAMTEDTMSIDWHPTFVSSLLLLSVFGTATVYWLWFTTLENVTLSHANGFSFLIPIFGLMMGITLYGEGIGYVQWLGIGLVVFGIWLTNRSSVQKDETSISLIR